MAENSKKPAGDHPTQNSGPGNGFNAAQLPIVGTADIKRQAAGKVAPGSPAAARPTAAQQTAAQSTAALPAAVQTPAAQSAPARSAAAQQGARPPKNAKPRPAPRAGSGRAPASSLPTVPVTMRDAAAKGSPSARRMLRMLVQGETPPTAPMSIVERLAGSPYANPMIQVEGADASARKTVDFALDLGETMFRYGAGALEVETSIIAVTAALGLRHIEVDITNQSILINYAKPETVPIMVLRVVRSWTNNYAGLVLVHRLVTEIVKGGLGRGEATKRLKAITRRPKPFPKWMVTVASAVFCGAIVGFLGGGIFASLVAMGSSVLVGVIARQLAKWRVADFFTTAASAFVVTAMALLFWWLHVPLSPSYVVAGGILLLLPSGRLVSAMQDAINGFPVSAAGRLLSAVLTFSALVSGISVALVAGALLGLGNPDVLAPGAGSYPLVVNALLLMLATAMVCISEQSRPALLLPTALVGLFGYLVFELVQFLGVGDRLAPAVAAVFMGFLARVAALRRGSPQLVVAVPAVLFLLPGLTIFRSMHELTVAIDNPLGGMLGLFNALVVILAIAAGVVLGDNLAQPLTKGLGSNERRRNRRR